MKKLINKKEESTKNKMLWIDIAGFIFRFFVIVFLFLLGIRSIIFQTQVNNILLTNIFLNLVGVILIFISFYLLYNSFSKKVKEEIYEKWFIGLVIVIFIYLITAFDIGSLQNIRSLFNLVKTAFVG